MFEGFESFDIEVEPNISIHCVQSGIGPPLLLLHGYPQTHHIWHLIAPQLTSTYTVIALDLRGYGASSKPQGSSSHIEYAKSTMARDCIMVMKHLGYGEFYICSHDRGSRVAHKLCIDYPHVVRKVILLDICPTLAMYGRTNQTFASTYWHWFFLIQASPFPEEMITAKPELVADKAFGGAYGGGGNLQIFDADAIKMYVQQLGDKTTVHGMCEDYRAGATIDLEEQRRDIEQGKKIKCPVTVLWGKKGLVGKMFHAVKEWSAVSEGEVHGEALDCGHYIPEEKAEDVIRHIKEFFV